MHNDTCLLLRPACLCCTCQNDSSNCCVVRFPGEDCIVTSCEAYEKEGE